MLGSGDGFGAVRGSVGMQTNVGRDPVDATHDVGWASIVLEAGVGWCVWIVGRHANGGGRDRHQNLIAALVAQSGVYACVSPCLSVASAKSRATISRRTARSTSSSLFMYTHATDFLCFPSLANNSSAPSNSPSM